MLTKEQLGQMPEAELVPVLISLLKAMAYQDVTKYHGGASEQGKDIVCWKTDDLGNRTNLALVVKAVPITGKASVAKGTAGEVQTQIQQCFGKRFLDAMTGEECQVNQCWVVSSKSINKEAEDAIMSALSPIGLNRNVRFVNGDKLWELIQKYLPVQAVWQKLEEASKTFDEIDTHYRPEVHLTESGIVINLREKFPGASNEKPLIINTTFSFPHTPEGQAAKEALERSFATGTPVDIPSSFIKAIELPDIFRKLGADDTHPYSLYIGTVSNPQPILVRIEFECDDGDRVTLPYIHLKATQVGTEEITLTNDEQPIPIRVTFAIRKGRQNAGVTIGFGDYSNVNQRLEISRLQTCMSKPATIRVIHLETGIPLFEARKDVSMGQAPNPRFVEALTDLVVIQSKLQRPIPFPRRELTEDEIQTINMLRMILHEGRLTTKWGETTISLFPQEARHALEAFNGGKVNQLGIEAEGTASLFGVELSLGPVRFFQQAVLTNEHEIRQTLETFPGEATAIECKFAPAGDGYMVTHYLDWLPHPNQSFENE